MSDAEDDAPEVTSASASAKATALDDDEMEFASADAGASKTEPRQCSSLRKNGFVMLKDRPCRIVEMSTSKTGKHGHAKVHLVGIDIFTGKKYEDLCPSTHNMDVPYVTRREFELTNISDENFLELMGEDGSMKEDVRVPESDLGKDIRARFEAGDSLVITVIAACGEEAAIALRNSVADKK